MVSLCHIASQKAITLRARAAIWLPGESDTGTGTGTGTGTSRQGVELLFLSGTTLQRANAQSLVSWAAGQPAAGASDGSWSAAGAVQPLQTAAASGGVQWASSAALLGENGSVRLSVLPSTTSPSSSNGFSSGVIAAVTSSGALLLLCPESGRERIALSGETIVLYLTRLSPTHLRQPLCLHVTALPSRPYTYTNPIRRATRWSPGFSISASL